MKPLWKNKFVTTWIAIFAILLSALAPSISSALTMRNASSPGWSEICSASNVYSSANKMSKKASGTSDAHESKHCPFCLPHAGNFALPPAVMPCCAVAAGHDAFPPLYYQAPSLLFSWVTANPRGPPQLS
ncbi:MAG: DUF2946 domain-containing protein [Undibacterium sp.]|nr:DUF2946 domain-containing protein [Undibacterium sp.]